MKLKHTPGTWVVHEEMVGRCQEQLWIAQDGFKHAPIALTEGPICPGERADYDRIAACVNACQGIAEPSVVQEMLKLLKRVPFQLSSANMFTPEQRKEIFAEIDAVVAKAEGRS